MLTSLKEYAKEIGFDTPTKKINKEDVEKLRGVFSKYARHDLSIDEIMKIEKEAWANSAAERYTESYDIA